MDFKMRSLYFSFHIIVREVAIIVLDLALPLEKIDTRFLFLCRYHTATSRMFATTRISSATSTLPWLALLTTQWTRLEAIVGLRV